MSLMSDLTLDQQIADAERALASATDYAERNAAGQTLDQLNGVKLAQARAERDAAAAESALMPGVTPATDSESVGGSVT